MNESVALLITSLLIAGACLASGHAPVPAPAVSADAVSICQIRQHPERYVGRVVTVSGIYKTDSSHYAYVLDPSCSSQSTLELGFKAPDRDGSVEAFEAAEAEECEHSGQRSRSICLLEASIVLRGEIAETKGAHLMPNLMHLVINPRSVLVYRFKAER
jgi:hypothetical protein